MFFVHLRFYDLTLILINCNYSPVTISEAFRFDSLFPRCTDRLSDWLGLSVRAMDTCLSALQNSTEILFEHPLSTFAKIIDLTLPRDVSFREVFCEKFIALRFSFACVMSCSLGL